MISDDKIRLLGSFLVLILASWLLYFRIQFQSDILFLDDLATDLFLYGGAWKDWKLSIAPAYIPDIILYFFGYMIFPSIPLRIFFVTACQALILSILALWLARKIRPQLSVNATALIILMVAFSSLVASRSGMWLFFNSTNNHISSLLLSFLSLGLILVFFKRPNLITAILIVGVGSIAKSSSAIFLICFTLPA